MLGPGVHDGIPLHALITVQPHPIVLRVAWSPELRLEGPAYESDMVIDSRIEEMPKLFLWGPLAWGSRDTSALLAQPLEMW